MVLSSNMDDRIGRLSYPIKMVDKASHWNMVTPNNHLNLGQHWPRNGLLPDIIRSLPEPILTFHRRGPEAHTKATSMGSTQDINSWNASQKYHINNPSTSADSGKFCANVRNIISGTNIGQDCE